MECDIFWGHNMNVTIYLTVPSFSSLLLKHNIQHIQVTPHYKRFKHWFQEDDLDVVPENSAVVSIYIYEYQYTMHNFSGKVERINY